jgi:hypothetical protein
MLLRYLLFLFALVPCPGSVSAQTGQLHVPPETFQALQRIYNGDTPAAVELARQIQKAHPEHPIGFLLEANARWWEIFCEACEFKWNTMDAWKRDKLPADDDYFALADRAIALAEARLKKAHHAEMFLYAGMGHALKARLLALRDEKRATARAGVRGREHLTNALQMDAQLADAHTGLGLYNYYVDTLSAIARILRFFMGIPGGSKKEGLAQLEAAIARGQLTQAEARFYLAKNLRNYEQQYARSVELMEPLVQQYPRNPVFHLLLGDFHAKLGHLAQAAASYRAAQQLTNGQSTPCAARIRQLSSVALAALPSPPQ